MNKNSKKGFKMRLNDNMEEEPPEPIDHQGRRY